MSKTYRWDILGQFDVLDETNVTRFQRALLIDLLGLLTQVKLLLQEFHYSILDRDINIGTLLDPLVKPALKINIENTALLWWIGIQHDMIDSIVTETHKASQYGLRDLEISRRSQKKV